MKAHSYNEHVHVVNRLGAALQYRTHSPSVSPMSKVAFLQLQKSLPPIRIKLKKEKTQNSQKPAGKLGSHDFNEHIDTQRERELGSGAARRMPRDNRVSPSVSPMSELAVLR